MIGAIVMQGLLNGELFIRLPKKHKPQLKLAILLGLKNLLELKMFPY